jgi:DUF917 family protein
VTVVSRTVSDQRAEQLCRFVARASGGRLGVARCPSKMGAMRNAVSPRSISLAMSIGRAIRECGASSVEFIKRSIRGKRLFEGEIGRVVRESREGFVWGEIEIIGIRDDWRHAYRIWFKNENLLGWKDGVLDICCPDQIIVLEKETGRGVYNWGDQLREGLTVVVLGAMASDQWRTDRGLELFGPKHFGFDIEYEPLVCRASRESNRKGAQ